MHVPDPRMLAVSRLPVAAIPLCYRCRVNTASVHHKVVHPGLFPFPERWRGVGTRKREKTVGMEHREPFRIWVTIVARFADAVEYLDRTDGRHGREFFTFPVRGKVEYLRCGKVTPASEFG